MTNFLLMIVAGDVRIILGKRPPARGKTARRPGGVYLNVHADSKGGDKLANLLALKHLIEAGLLKPAIDRVYPLRQRGPAGRRRQIRGCRRSSTVEQTTGAQQWLLRTK